MYGQRGLWEVTDFPCSFMQNLGNQDFLPSFWSNARVTLKRWIFHFVVIQPFFPLWLRNQSVDNVKNIYHINWFDQIDSLNQFEQFYWMEPLLTKPADSRRECVSFGRCFIRESKLNYPFAMSFLLNLILYHRFTLSE